MLNGALHLLSSRVVRALLLIDVRSVDVLRILEATLGIELIEFACPRCRTPHASLRFG
jgi:hypothetical protein